MAIFWGSVFILVKLHFRLSPLKVDLVEMGNWEVKST
jgi:hypothetical protein